MEAAIVLALKSRLQRWQVIDAQVACDAWGLMQGRFSSMSILGKHWLTPLRLTARALEVGPAAVNARRHGRPAARMQEGGHTAHSAECIGAGKATGDWGQGESL